MMDMSSYATGLAHIGIPTTEFEDTALFYTELGFDTIYACGSLADKNRVCFMRLGDLTVEIYEEESCAMCTGGIEHFAINVHDIEEVFAFINKRGLNNTDDEIHFLPYFENGVRYFTIEGPNKERVEFNQYL